MAGAPVTYAKLESQAKPWGWNAGKGCHFGSAVGVMIDYHEEKTPLGTACALATVANHEEPFLR
jgi:hypothetical protein